MESVYEKRLPTGKTTQEVTWASIVLPSALSAEVFIDKQRKAVRQGAEIKATRAS